ncbi:hypothetical protein L1887_42345 [Cichorium endivia]|nr:hypothetical protein L1887_42345 [Cichorium endivia]
MSGTRATSGESDAGQYLCVQIVGRECVCDEWSAEVEVGDEEEDKMRRDVVLLAGGFCTFLGSRRIPIGLIGLIDRAALARGCNCRSAVEPWRSSTCGLEGDSQLRRHSTPFLQPSSRCACPNHGGASGAIHGESFADALIHARRRCQVVRHDAEPSVVATGVAGGQGKRGAGTVHVPGCESGQGGAHEAHRGVQRVAQGARAQAGCDLQRGAHAAHRFAAHGRCRGQLGSASGHPRRTQDLRRTPDDQHCQLRLLSRVQRDLSHERGLLARCIAASVAGRSGRSGRGKGDGGEACGGRTDQPASWTGYGSAVARQPHLPYRGGVCGDGQQQDRRSVPHCGQADDLAIAACTPRRTFPT